MHTPKISVQSELIFPLMSQTAQSRAPLTTQVARAATKVNPTVVNAVHAFYHGDGIDTECPDYNITQHASTGRRYPSARAFYSSIHETNTRKSRGEESNLTDYPSGGEM